MNVIDKDTSNLNDFFDKFIPNNQEETNMVKLLNKYKNTSGFDERYLKNNELDNELLKNIKISFIKYTLLKQLESSHISQNTKIEVIKENRYLFEEPANSINLTAGDLFKDWDFTL
jgi:hypothetical protein